MKLRSRNTIKANFEMSSMTDLVFLLLIFFMLITTLMVPSINALKLTLPNSDSAKPTENLTISVSINENLQYFLDAQPIAPEQLESNLNAMVANKLNPVIVLHTAKSVPIENVVKVMDVANHLRIKMVLATSPEK
ncbi:MAG TPA: biopolymer transporter ExbD [Bacteroidia bacterium]|nr:biopolymer transporter ExbD [Bacteroidia bacterium]HNT79269.1 biopolymer transporter ExbD [Bacteroidia bacterium]